MFCSSPAVVLGESLAALTVHSDDTDTRPLPDRFITIYVDWKFLIIALMVKMGAFTALALFLTLLIFEAQLSLAANQKYILWFFSL